MYIIHVEFGPKRKIQHAIHIEQLSIVYIIIIPQLIVRAYYYFGHNSVCKRVLYYTIGAPIVCMFAVNKNRS